MTVKELIIELQENIEKDKSVENLKVIDGRGFEISSTSVDFWIDREFASPDDSDEKVCYLTP